MTKLEQKVSRETSYLEQLGYQVHSYRVGDFSKRLYTLTNTDCGHQFEMRYDNLQSVFKRTAKLSCSVCGKKDNVKLALKSYKQKHSSLSQQLVTLLKQKKLDVKIEKNVLTINSKLSIIIASDLDENVKTFSDSTLYIREYELRFSLNKVVTRIIHKCQTGNRVQIHARKCDVVTINNDLAKKFCDSNHIQGNIGSSVKLGLETEEGELVALMTFGKPRFNKQYQWELIRFCTKSNVTIPGGASKLLSAFKKLHDPTSILSYADARWSDGNVYEKIGFSFIEKTSTFYYVDAKGDIVSRYRCQKHRLSELLEIYDDTITAGKNLTLNGYRKVNEPGQLVYGWFK